MMSDKDTLQNPPDANWYKKKEFILLATMAVFVKFGDGVEIFLPGVITQKVSCDLKLSHTQEGILSGILYIFIVVGNLSSVLLAKKVGEKVALLCSLYMSVLSTALCSVVPNYYTLLLSRALIGLGCGLNASPVGVFCAKNVSSQEILNKLTLLHSCIAFILGGFWASVLGWLLLDTLNWRIFVLITSIPLFIPPIIILHLWDSRCNQDEVERTQTEVKGTQTEVEGTQTEVEETQTETTSLMKAQSETEPVDDFAVRTLKSSLFLFFCSYIIFGIVMVMPALIEKSNLKGKDIDAKNCEHFIIHGNQYLILVGVVGSANIIGRPFGYLLRGLVRFVVLQTALMVFVAVTFGVILTRPGLMVESVMMGIAKFCCSIHITEALIIQFDVGYFGSPNLALGSALMEASGKLSAVITVFVAAFIDPYHSLIIMLAVCVAQIAVICSMNERH